MPEKLGVTLAKMLAMSVYYIAIGADFLCVLYHLLLIMLTSNSYRGIGFSTLGYGRALAAANFAYFVLMLLLINIKGWKAFAHNPLVIFFVLLSIPGLIYLNYIWVNTVSPYYSGF